MAKNKIEIDVSTTDKKGSTKKVAMEQKKLANQINRTGNAAATTAESYRKTQGAAQNSANSTKNFAKTARGLEGIVPIYATFAANVFAISAAFNILRRNAALEQLEASLTRTGLAAGQNLPLVAKGLRDITNQAISAEQSLRATAIATASGFSSAELQGLTQVAKGASIALGRDLGDALDRLVRGTAKLEPEILDELGIIVRLDEAARNYARTLNKQATELTRAERTQAFLNATIEQGLKKYNDTANAFESNPYDKLASSVDNLVKRFLQLFGGPIADGANFLSESVTGLVGVFALLGSTVVKQVAPKLEDFVSDQAEISKVLEARAGDLLSDTSRTVQQLSSELPKAASLGVKEGLKVYDVVEKLNNKQVLGLEEIKSGTSSAGQIQSHLRKQQKGQSVERVAELQKEIDMLEAVKNKLREINKVQKAARNDVEGLNAGFISAQIDTERSTDLESVFQKINQSGGMNGLLIGAKGIGAEFKRIATSYTEFDTELSKATGVGILTRKLKVLKLTGVQTFKSLSASVKIFGAAFLNAIPLIGQAIFLFSLLEPILVPLGKKIKSIFVEPQSEIDKLKEKLETTFSSVDKSLNFLDNNIAVNDLTASYRIQLGIVQQITSEILTQKKASEDLTAEKVKNLRKELNAEEAKLSIIERRIKSISSSSSVVGLEISKFFVEKAIKDVESQIGTELSGSGKAGIDSALVALDIGLDTIKNASKGRGEAVQKAAQSATRSLNQLRTSIQSGASTNQIELEIQKIALSFQNIVDLPKTLSEGFSQFQDVAGKALKKVESPLDRVSAVVLALRNGVAALAEGGLKNASLVSLLGDSEQAAGVQKILDLAKAYNVELDKSLSEAPGQEILTSLLDRIQEKLKKQSTTIASSSEVTKSLKEELNRIKQITSQFPGLVNLEIAARKTLLDQQIEGVKTQIDSNNKLIQASGFAEDGTKFAEQQSLLAEQTRLERQRELLILSESLSLDIGRVQQANAFLSIVTKLNSSYEQVKQSQNSILEDEQKLKNIAQERADLFSGFEDRRARREGSSDLALQKRIAKDSIAAEEAKLGLTKQRINLEFELLKAQLEKQKLENPNNQELINAANNLINLQKTSRDLSIQAAEASTQKTLSGITTNVAILEESLRKIDDGLAEVAVSFAQNLSNGIADVLRGRSSIKDALLSVTNSVLDTIAQQTGELLTNKLIDFVNKSLGKKTIAEKEAEAEAEKNAKTTQAIKDGFDQGVSSSGDTFADKINQAIKSGADYHSMKIMEACANKAGLSSDSLESSTGMIGGTLQEVKVTGKRKPLENSFPGVDGKNESKDKLVKSNEEVSSGLMETTTSLLATGSILTTAAAAITGNTDSNSTLAKVQQALTFATIALKTVLIIQENKEAIMSIFSAAKGGVMPKGLTSITPYATGGIVKRPTLGLVGEGKYNEAVVPLPDGKKIPVDLSNMPSKGQENNVSVNINIDNSGATTESSSSTSQEAAEMGKRISQLVRIELQNQKRAGGILSPYS